MSSEFRPNLAPEGLVADATSLDLVEFLEQHGDPLLLLVRIPPGDTDLELGLDSGRAAGAKPLPFRTGYQGRPKNAPLPAEARRGERIRIAEFLSQHPHVAVPLHKRADGDTAFMERISVGRAQNKDIVLRHSSISKFHAWFEIDESQAVRLFDSGSTNRTHVNGRPIDPKTWVTVASGDVLQFGAVQGILCSPEMLWCCLNRPDDGTPVR